MADDKEDEGKEDLRNPDVVTKYRKAGEITTAAMQHVLSLCKPGAKIVDLCAAGDAFIEEACGKIYNKGKVEKGVGFPACISVNNLVGHFSPVATDETVLKEGDLAKLDIGAHVDGYISVAAHTFLIGAEGISKDPVSGKAGDLLAAAYTASECAQRMLKVGGKNTAITEMISKVCEDFKCNAVQGVLSHQMQRFQIDGEKVIINKGDIEQKVDEVEFEPNEVYAMDIVMSTGEGKPKEVDSGRTTVFKRSTDETYQLKMKASRAVLSDITKRFPTFPFTLRAMEAKTARFGISECLKHDLVTSYPVLYEKDGELVVHLKFTVLLMPTGTIKITGSPIDASSFKTELSLKDEDLKKLLLTSTGAKKKKKKPKKKAEKKTEGESKE